MSHTMKLWERIIEARIRKEVTITEQQFGSMPGRSTTDAIFCPRMLLEKWTEGQIAVHCAFIDLEKAYDRVPREELWECLRLAETSECYIKIIQDMYDGATTTVRSAAGLTKEFKLGVGLHQGSALSPFLFFIISSSEKNVLTFLDNGQILHFLCLILMSMTRLSVTSFCLLFHIFIFFKLHLYLNNY